MPITKLVCNPNSFICRRNLPRSLLIGIPVVAVCYILVNLAYFSALPYHQISGPQAVALVRELQGHMLYYWCVCVCADIWRGGAGGCRTGDYSSDCSSGWIWGRACKYLHFLKVEYHIPVCWGRVSYHDFVGWCLLLLEVASYQKSSVVSIGTGTHPSWLSYFRWQPTC